MSNSVVQALGYSSGSGLNWEYEFPCFLYRVYQWTEEVLRIRK